MSVSVAIFLCFFIPHVQVFMRTSVLPQDELLYASVRFGVYIGGGFRFFLAAMLDSHPICLFIHVTAKLPSPPVDTDVITYTLPT